MPSFIIIESGSLRGRRYKLDGAALVGIGRDAKCAIRLDDGMASRVHCVLRGQKGDGGDKWLLEDRGSSNGTLINSRTSPRDPAGGG